MALVSVEDVIIYSLIVVNIFHAGNGGWIRTRHAGVSKRLNCYYLLKILSALSDDNLVEGSRRSG